VKEGSPIKGIDDLAGKRVAALVRSTYARIILEQVPKAILVEFEDQPSAFRALVQGTVDAYTSDGVQLYGLKHTALWGMYQWLDRAPKGRNEMGVWLRRHDEYSKG
jgi:ABC-type amino acid transport substrate-binding protein